MKKGFIKIIICIAAVLSLLGVTACDLQGVGVKQKTLSAPTNVRVENGSLYWNPVEHASGYTVSIDNKEYPITDYQYPLSTISDGEHIFKVKATGDGVLYLSSSWSQECKETLTAGEKSSTDYYGQFDELTKQESFLGYGFDVINSSVFSDKYVKTSFPIFNTQKLMEQRLLKVDSKQSYVEEIKSSDMEQFLQDWNAKANVDVKWGGKKVGGSVEVKTKYSGGVENARSKYFHSISFYNQKFYIVLQSDINTYKQIINDSFKADLYSDMEPAELFERYGTHFITSAVMGGKINSYYLYTSESEKSYHKISASVSTEVRVFKTGVDVEVGGGYKNEAKNENIYIENTLEVIGGEDFGMISDEDISKNYLAWEKSLDEHASLMGIKDTSSLIPLWQLIDSNMDTKTYTWVDVNGETQTGNRSQQLQSYFQKYGIEAYNSLMQAADLPEIIVPEKIDNIKVNNNSVNNIGEYEVFAGVNNDISFTVSPDNATGYSKTASLSENTDLATIDTQNGISLIISPDCEHGKVFNVVLSAGSVRETIKVRVIKKYTVIFKSNGGTEISALLNVEHDSQIDEPTPPEKEGYVFIGWYTTGDFKEGTKFQFGVTPVVGDLTLYAKWEEYYLEISFVHNVQGSTLVKDKVKYNTAYIEPSAPKLTGHVVKGFYKDQEMLVPFDFTTLIKQPTTIYVKWEVELYEVAFISDCDIDVPTQQVAYKNKAQTPIEVYKEGYQFMGWYINGAFNGPKFDFNNSLITENVTLYAQWAENPITIVFDGNGGNTVDSESILKGQSLGSKLPIATKENYIFDGWYLSNELNESEKVYSNTTFNENTVLYAKWTSNFYNIEYNLNDSGLKVSQKIEPEVFKVVGGQNYVLSIPEINNYYKFIGWFTEDGNRLTSADGSSVSAWAFLEDIVVYAQWEKADKYADFEYITEKEEFIKIQENLHGKYLLLNDIELGENWIPLGTYYWEHSTVEDLIEHTFSGIIDGAGHNVSYSITIDNTITSHMDYAFGLFGTADNATFKNINLTTKIISINNPNCRECVAGGFVGMAKNSTFENCSVFKDSIIANENTDETYDILGYMQYTGATYAGGFVGDARNCTFTTCKNYASVSVAGYSAYSGGIAGNAYECKGFETCENEGDISSNRVAWVYGRHANGDLYGKSNEPWLRDDGSAISVNP